ncbi:MAG: 16S rRNA (cytosine(1402)-N(4))-methyltransferase, partial [Myxococcaceae bacterium]|nr:16S rRNA (cytosine(1402)-N(4))-methyltransferase [Myxococcaceae bacterium]
MSASFHHVTVLLNEAVAILRPSEGRVIVDGTLGGG